jgi:hypothetical protein
VEDAAPPGLNRVSAEAQTAIPPAIEIAGLFAMISMSHPMRDLSDDQWVVLDTLIAKPKRRIDGRG